MTPLSPPTGPADEITKVLQQLPATLHPSGLELQPTKTQIWAPHSERLRNAPLLRDLRNKMKDPRGLIVVGEALGHTDVESFPVEEDAFVADHLRDVAETFLTDLRNIGCLPDIVKLHSGQAGVQVAWALLAKTLPPRVIHLLRAHPSQRRRSFLQEGLQDTVRQLLGVPSTAADQLRVARLPVSAGGLGLPHLPSLAVIARCAALATLPRASDTARYRQTLLDSETDLLFHRLRDVCDRDLATLAGNLVEPPRGSASDTSAASLLIPAILRPSTLCGFVCPADGLPPCSIRCSVGASSNALVLMPQGGQPCGRTPQRGGK